MTNDEYNDYDLPEVGAWSQRKYDLIRHYAEMFSTSMKNKWDCRVYIDCFCGCGLSKIKKTQRVMNSSATIAMEIKYPFDKYIFCDSDKNKLNLLKKYINQRFSSLDVTFIDDDVNESVDSILSAIPKPSKNFKVLSFCLLDPYKISNLQFNIIKKISDNVFVDFLILIPSYMDANRNEGNFKNNDYLDNFLGTTSWRDDWEKNKNNHKNFAEFVVTSFDQQMEKLGFLSLKKAEFVKISEPKRNCPLYHLAFYSKSKLGKKFWKESITSSDPQISFEF